MDETSNLALPYILPNQAQKHVTYNEALRMLDAVVQIGVESRSRSEPPAAPTEGARFIPGAGASGAWAGGEGRLAAFQDGAWMLYPPQAGWLAYVADEAMLIAWNGAAWISAGGGEAASINPAPFVGVNATADAANRLLVKSPATLFDHDGAGHQFKINKAAAADTASLLFQSAYSGRAELGLAGNEDFELKVSTDGEAFMTALKVDRTTGFIGAGAGAPASRFHITEAADARLTIETSSAGTGGGFDVLNSGDGQNWRVTGSASNLKIRDHTAKKDKFIVEPTAAGPAYFVNTPKVGVGTAAPTTQLHVAGPVRVGAYAVADLPDAAAAGEGAIVYATDAAAGATLAFSDGALWRRADTGGVVG